MFKTIYDLGIIKKLSKENHIMRRLRPLATKAAYDSFVRKTG